MKKLSIVISLMLLCQVAFSQIPSGRKLFDKATQEVNRQSESKQTSPQEQQRPSRDEIGNSWNDVEILFNKPFIFSKGEMQVGGDAAGKKEAYGEAIKKSNAVIEEYKMAVDKFMQGNPSPSIYGNKLKISEAKSKGVVTTIKQADNEFKGGNSLGGVYYLQQIYIYKGYLDAQTKVFPESQIIKDHLQMANDAIQKYGSTEQFLGKMEKNKQEYAKNLKLIPAGQKNSTIEALVKTEYEAFSKNFRECKLFCVNESEE